MSNYRWRDSPDTIARLVNADKIKTIATQQVLLKPNEACAMIVDGRIGDILTETLLKNCLLYTSPSPRDRTRSRMPSSA